VIFSISLFIFLLILSSARCVSQQAQCEHLSARREKAPLAHRERRKAFVPSEDQQGWSPFSTMKGRLVPPGHALFFLTLLFLDLSHFWTFAQLNMTLPTKLPPSGIKLTTAASNAPNLRDLRSTTVQAKVLDDVKQTSKLPNVNGTAKRKFRPDQEAKQPSLLTLRGFPQGAASMSLQQELLIMPLPNVRSIATGSEGLGAAASVNYITVEANVPLAQLSYQASPQSYMKR
jgi:hypothetical protein